MKTEQFERICKEYGVEWLFYENTPVGRIKQKIKDYLKNRIAKKWSVKNVLNEIRFESAFEVVEPEQFIRKTGLPESQKVFTEVFKQGVITLGYDSILDQYVVQGNSRRAIEMVVREETNLDSLIEGYSLKKIFNPDIRSSEETKKSIKDELTSLNHKSYEPLCDFTDAIQKSIIDTCIGTENVSKLKN